MKRIFPAILLLLCIFISTASSAHADGKIAFTKSEYTREGFQQAIRGSRASRQGWWELYRRDICVINPDGTGLKQLTEDGVSYRPKWSPNGRKIAFLSSPPPTVSLHVMGLDGSNRQELISNQQDILDLDWSPDSTAILVVIKTKDIRDSEESWIITLDGGSVKRMGSSKWARGWNHWDAEGAKVLNRNKRLIEALPDGIDWPEWSPDNKYLAFVHEGILAIADVEVVGMPEDWRTSNLEPPCNRIEDWSQDSSKILFFAGGNVSSINFDGTGVANLSMSSASDACWSPDALQIAYTATDGRKRNTEIFVMNADGTGHVQITNTNYFHMDVDWR